MSRLYAAIFTVPEKVIAKDRNRCRPDEFSMKPLGTITMYYPFLEESLVGKLDAIMARSTNYYDFVLRLGEKAAEEELETDLVYLACVHAWRLSVPRVTMKLNERFGQHPLVAAWTLPLREYGYDLTSAMLDNAIESTNADWIRIELLYLKAWLAMYVTEVTTTFRIIDIAESVLDKNVQLECFSSSIYSVKHEYSFLRRMNDEAFASYERAMSIASKYDDRYRVYQLLGTHAGYIRTYDLQKAFALVEEAHRLAQSFGSPQKIAESLADYGRVCESSGEYDSAIKCYSDSLDAYGYPEMEWHREPMDSPCYCLSRVYCELGDGKSALEWVQNAFDHAGEGASEMPYLYAQRAEALILESKSEKAMEDIIIGKRLAVRSGRSGNLAMCAIAEGYYEMMQNNADGALSVLSPAFEYLMGGAGSIFANRVLIALVRAEMRANLENYEGETSGPWMDLLERHAVERNLPGIQMLHAILKAEYLASHGLVDSAANTLKDALQTNDSQSVITLRERIQSQLTFLESSRRIP